MEELLKNAEEFLESAEENFEKKRYNACVSDYFKEIVILADYLIYREIKRVPKNHNERFYLLKRYFEEVYERVSVLFKTYTESYNLRLGLKDAEEVKKYANEFKNYVDSKK